MKPVFRVAQIFFVFLLTLFLSTPAYAGHKRLCLTAPSSYGLDSNKCTKFGSNIGSSQSFKLSEHGEHAVKARIILAHYKTNYSCTRIVTYSSNENKYETKTTNNCTGIPKGWNTGSISIFKNGRWHFRPNLMFYRK